MRAKRFILQWLWILPLLIWFALTVQAKLSNETKELVDDLRIKHYGYSALFYIPKDSDLLMDWTDYYSWTMTFENGTLYIETQDGKWFIEMKRKEE